jgi:hypothetical protein
VTLTHVWAIEKRAPLQEWVNSTSEIFRRAGFGDVTTRTDAYRSGDGLLLRAHKRRPCNRIAT